LKKLSAVAAVGLMATFAFAAPGDAGTKNGGSGEVNPCGDDGVITYSPTTLWPPNHKDQTITITYTDPDAESVSLSITGNPHNEIIEGEEINGTGNTPPPDSTLATSKSADGNTVTVEVFARSERSGHKNADGGRVYEFDYDAKSEENGLPHEDDGCMSSAMTSGDGLIVFVPHDQGKRPNS
jgi:hypothetical protein